MKLKNITLPFILTLARLIISPVILPFLLVYFLPYDNLIINSLLGVFFLLLAATDFFDGYCARKFNQETRLGKLLDPLADKFLISCTLISLLAIEKIYFFWVILFIARDLLITGLRTIACEYSLQIPVSYLAKVKTMLLMLLLTFLIIKPYTCSTLLLKNIEYVLLGTAILLSLATALRYVKTFIQAMRYDN